MLWWRRFVRGRHEAGMHSAFGFGGVVQPLARVQHGGFSYLFCFSLSFPLSSFQQPLPTFQPLILNIKNSSMTA